MQQYKSFNMQVLDCIISVGDHGFEHRPLCNSRVFLLLIARVGYCILRHDHLVVRQIPFNLHFLSVEVTLLI